MRQSVVLMTATEKVVGLVVCLLLVSALIPTAMSTILEVNTTTWTPAMVAIWNAIPVLSLVGVALLIIYIAITKD